MAWNFLNGYIALYLHRYYVHLFQLKVYSFRAFFHTNVNFSFSIVQYVVLWINMLNDILAPHFRQSSFFEFILSLNINDLTVNVKPRWLCFKCH